MQTDTNAPATGATETATMPTAQNGVTMEDAYAELCRELDVRKRCYGKWIKEGKISRTDAKDRGSRMEAACEFLYLGLIETGWKPATSEASDDEKPF